MALLKGNFYSEALGMNTDFTAILPEAAVTRKHPGKTHPVLYLLHGGIHDDTSIVRDTNLVTFVKELFPELIVIMPNGDFSFYTDHKGDYPYAYQYQTYISDELTEITRTLFPVSHKREETYIYGWSMGGFGALTAGLNHPEQYGSIGAQCGMVDIVWAVATRDFPRVKHGRMFGEPPTMENSEYDFRYLTSRLNQSDGPRPRIFHCWTTEDYLREINEKFHEHCKTLHHLDYTPLVVPGVHGWGENGIGLKSFIQWLAQDYDKQEVK